MNISPMYKYNDINTLNLAHLDAYGVSTRQYQMNVMCHCCWQWISNVTLPIWLQDHLRHVGWRQLPSIWTKGSNNILAKGNVNIFVYSVYRGEHTSGNNLSDISLLRNTPPDISPSESGISSLNTKGLTVLNNTSYLNISLCRILPLNP